jgi:two-component system, LytTR family, response regulator AlgR
VKIGRREQLVPLDEIDCFVAEDGYVMARSARVEGFVDLPLKDLEIHLGSAVLRVHRSCLVVQSSVSAVETRVAGGRWIRFRDGLAPVFVSRRRGANLSSLIRPPRPTRIRTPPEY